MTTKDGRETHATVRWVHGHEGNIGNEEADSEAEIVARGQSSKHPTFTEENDPNEQSCHDTGTRGTLRQRKHREPLHSRQECRQAETNRSLLVCHPKSLKLAVAWATSRRAGPYLAFQIFTYSFALEWTYSILNVMHSLLEPCLARPSVPPDS